jgi:hypothetical protein
MAQNVPRRGSSSRLKPKGTKLLARTDSLGGEAAGTWT